MKKSEPKYDQIRNFFFSNSPPIEEYEKKVTTDHTRTMKEKKEMMETIIKSVKKKTPENDRMIVQQ